MNSFRLFIILALSLLLISCEEDKPRNTVATQVYTVMKADRNYSKGSLKLSEIEEYIGDRMITKTFKGEDGKIKGIEKCDFNNAGTKATCHYYDAAGDLLSYYENEYLNGHKTLSRGYDAENDELLRVEKFYYDEHGNRIRKEILDGNDLLQKSYNFVFDQYGNEIKMTATDQDEKPLLTYDYEIVETDTTGKWLKLWGYINNDSIPSTLKTCTRSRPM